MKLFFIILCFVFITKVVDAQTCIAYWTGTGHTSYQVQQSLDSSHWTTIATINNQISSNNYQCVIPGPTFYYRIKADNDTTKALLVADALSIKNPNHSKGKIKNEITSFDVSVIVNSKIHYTIISQRNQTINYSIYNYIGQKLNSQPVILHIGQNEFYDEKPNISGIYYATFQGYFDFKPIKILIK